MQKLKPKTEDMVALAVFVIEFTNMYMNIPGKIENLVILIDLKDLGVFTAPYGLLKAVISTI